MKQRLKLQCQKSWPKPKKKRRQPTQKNSEKGVIQGNGQERKFLACAGYIINVLMTAILCAVCVICASKNNNFLEVA